MEHNKSVIRKLTQQRNNLEKQVLSLAKFNYAREPEFVRDRLRLRELVEEVSQLVKHTHELARKLKPLQKCLKKQTEETRQLEEKSEAMAQDFLQGNMRLDEFTSKYVDLRKETVRKRLIVDGLTGYMTLAKKYNSAHATTVDPNNPNNTCPIMCG